MVHAWRDTLRPGIEGGRGWRGGGIYYVPGGGVSQQPVKLQFVPSQLCTFCFFATLNWSVGAASEDDSVAACIMLHHASYSGSEVVIQNWMLVK